MQPTYLYDIYFPLKLIGRETMVFSTNSIKDVCNLNNFLLIIGDAVIQKQKAEFLEAEKDLLVKEMLEMNLEPKHYKVELFINIRFNVVNKNIE